VNPCFAGDEKEMQVEADEAVRAFEDSGLDVTEDQVREYIRDLFARYTESAVPGDSDISEPPGVDSGVVRW